MKTMFEIYYGRELKVFIYNPECEAALKAAEIVSSNNCVIVNSLDEADLAIAPLLNKKLSISDYSKPKFGSLIFHPSLLPRHRGPDAIKWAYKLNESYTGVTWFWCSEGYDEGDICEQEVVALDTEIRPRDFYDKVIIPAMLRTLGRALEDLKRGIVRRIPQNESAATYEKKYPQVTYANN